jgi:hypothetical protein
MGKLTTEVTKNIFLSLFLTLALTLLFRFGAYTYGGAWVIIAVFIFTFTFIGLIGWFLGMLNYGKLNEIEDKLSIIAYRTLQTEMAINRIERKNVPKNKV